MSNNATEKDILWESHHEHVANTLFALGAEMTQLIVEFYKRQRVRQRHSSHYKLVKSAIYNEWGITEGMLHMTFQWPDDNENKDDIIITLRNRHIDIIDGWCPQALQDALLQSQLVQQFILLDEEYGIFVQQHATT
jgi:hypothetical protein